MAADCRPESSALVAHGHSTSNAGFGKRNRALRPGQEPARPASFWRAPTRQPHRLPGGSTMPRTTTTDSFIISGFPMTLSAGGDRVWRDDVSLPPQPVLPDQSADDDRLLIGDYTSARFGDDFSVDIEQIRLRPGVEPESTTY